MTALATLMLEVRLRAFGMAVAWAGGHQIPVPLYASPLLNFSPYNPASIPACCAC